MPPQTTIRLKSTRDKRVRSRTARSANSGTKRAENGPVSPARVTTATSRNFSQPVWAGDDAAIRTSDKATIHCELVNEEKTSCGPGTSATASAAMQRPPRPRSTRADSASAQTASMTPADIHTYKAGLNLGGSAVAA